MIPLRQGVTALSPLFLAGMVSLGFSTAGCQAVPLPMRVPDQQPAPVSGGMTSPVGFPQYPSLSPDGATVVFGWAGDLWASPVSGGIADRLTAHPAEERRSAFSPDGRLLAFESSRDGGRNLYVAPVWADGGRVVLGTAVRVTAFDAPQSLGGFSADGRSIVFASTREPSVYRSTRLYRVDLNFDGEQVTGGGAVSRLTDAFGSTVRAGDKAGRFVMTRGSAGIERPKYRGSGNQDVVFADLDSKTFEPVAPSDANDTDPWLLPDGSVVFISSRDGQNNVWKAPSGGGAPVQLTRFAPADGQFTIGHGVRDLAVSADGRRAVFAVWDTLYWLDLTQPQPEPQAIVVRAAADSAQLDFQRMNLDREVSEQAISPDGKTLAVVARGEVFVRNVQEGYPTRRVTDTAGRERDLAWSPDGRVLYFASDDAGDATPEGSPDGVYQVYGATVSLSREDLGQSKPPGAAKAEQEDEPKSGEPPVEPAAPVRPEGEQQPDPKPAGDAPASDSAKVDTKGTKPEKKPDHGKRWADSLQFKIELVVESTGSPRLDVRNPTPSPDGKQMLYTRGRGDLIMRNLESGEDQALLESWDEPEAQWAADSRHIVYAVSDLDFNSDIWLMDTQSPRGGAASDAPDAKRRWANPVNLTQHPDLDYAPRLSADGKVLVFLSERLGENFEFDVWAVALDRSLEAMTDYERDEYFKKAAEAAGKRKPPGTSSPAGKDDAKKEGDEKKAEGDKADSTGKTAEADKAPKPLEFDAEDAYLRVRRITSLPGAESNLAITPAADRIVFVGNAEGDRALYSVDFKGGDRKTLQAGGGSDVSMSLTGDKVFFVRSGQVSTTNPKTGGKVDTLAIDAPVTVDIAAQQRQKFLEASRTIGAGFYHQTLKGLDWDGLSRRYLSLAERTRTNEEFNRVTNMLFGELDGSHLGIGGGRSARGGDGPAISTGYLGVFATPVAGGYRVEHVVRGSPADAKTTRLSEGDVIVAIDGTLLAADAGSIPTTDLDAALAGRAGKETLVEVRLAEGGTTRKMLMVPVGLSTWDNLQYWDEIGQRQRKVEELSGGKLGYLHIRAMGESSVRDFERDLYAAAHAKQGLIIDVRDNGGGSTADILLASLLAPNHAWTAPRGVDLADVPRDAYPRDRRLIYGWTRPINVLINQNSFSNAEIFAHAIKTTGRGKLVGTPTFGGVISTGGIQLIDGTSVRTPFRGWYLPDGTDMENNGAQPDVSVPQTPEDEVAERDRQLEAAVTELLSRIEPR